MLAHDDTGDGPPLVLVHGLAASRWIWSMTSPLLREWRRIAVDVPGFGATPAAGEGFALDEVADHLWEYLPVQEPVTLVGHSMGGSVALAAAALAPERVARLVLVAPTGLQPMPPTAARVAAALGDGAVRLRRSGLRGASSPLGRRLLLAASTAPGDLLREETVRQLVLASEGATRVREALTTVLEIDQREQLRQLPVPVGLLWGSDDRVISRSVLATAQELRPEAPLELVPRAGHLPMVERPATFAAMLRQVLARLG